MRRILAVILAVVMVLSLAACGQKEKAEKYCSSCGEGVSKDLSEAVRWYRKAAEQGIAQAQYNLGVCYEFGKGVSKDQAEAVRWYRKAAEQGDARAQCNLGYCYNNGVGLLILW